MKREVLSVRDEFIDNLNSALIRNFDYVPLSSTLKVADILIDMGWKFTKEDIELCCQEKNN